MMIRGLTSGMKSRADAERRVLEGAGVKPVYDDLNECIKSLRRGNLVGVVDLRALGRKRSDIRANLERLHEGGWAAVTVPDGRRSDGKHGADLLSEAIDKLGTDRRGPRKKLRRDKRMPWDQIAAIWFRKDLDNKHVMAVINGDSRYSAKIGYTTVYNKLGKRNVLTGRPSKKD